MAIISSIYFSDSSDNSKKDGIVAVLPLIQNMPVVLSSMFPRTYNITESSFLRLLASSSLKGRIWRLPRTSTKYRCH